MGIFGNNRNFLCVNNASVSDALGALAQDVILLFCAFFPGGKHNRS